MKTNYFFMLAILLLPIYSAAQECSANPGGDQEICLSDEMFLYGEDSDLYLKPVHANWTASTNNPIPVIIQIPTNLETAVLPDASQGFTEFVSGNYEFELCVICFDGSEACQSLNIYVGDILNPPTIVESDMTICGSEITLHGSAPDLGVNAIWFVDDFSGDLEQVGTDFILNHNGNSPCTYTILYIHTIGECEEVASIDITFIEEYEEVFAVMVSPASCPSCTNRIQVRGNGIGCGGFAQWTVVDQPTGVIPTDITIESPNSSYTWIEVPADGEYTFGYEIENGDCLSGSATLTCEINDVPNFTLGQDESYSMCGDTWDITTLFFDENYIPGATYEWFVTGNIADNGISFSDPTSNSTYVNFAYAPMDVSSTGFSFQISVIMRLNGCEVRRNYSYAMIPDLSLENESINLLCGGDPSYSIKSNLNVIIKSGSITGKVLSSPSLPVGYLFSLNTSLDLTDPGEHCFEVVQEFDSEHPITEIEGTCLSIESFCVLVADVPTIDCGSPITTCLLTTQLNGNTPLGEDGEPLNIPVLWEQTGGPMAIISDQNLEDPFISGLEYGNTYTFKYTISDEPDCMIFCENTITVNPEEECPHCDIKATVGECLNGCTTVNLSGADTYTWIPATNIDNTDPENPVICNTENTTYQVIGSIDGETCSSLILEIPGCEGPAVTCDFVLERFCGMCGCGDPVGGGKLYDGEGNYIDVEDSGINLEWVVDGEIVSEGHNAYAPHYTDPFVLCAHVSFTQADGTLCDTTMCIDVTCHGDCPEVSFATCADAPFSDYPECADYDPERECFPGGFAGYVWAVDQAGYPIDNNDYNFNFNGYGSQNPTFIDTWGNGGCDVEFVIGNTIGCDTTITFSPDCCSKITPDIWCGSMKGDCWEINFGEICGTESYILSVTCMDDFETTTYEIPAADIRYTGTYCLPIPKGCTFMQVSLTAICSSGAEGAASNCIYIDVSNRFCYEGVDPCDDFKSGERSLVTNEEVLREGLIFPNPSKVGTFFYQPKRSMGTELQSLTLNIMDISGKLLYSTLLESNEAVQEIRTGLESGLYLVNIINEKGVILDTQRFIITGH